MKVEEVEGELSEVKPKTKTRTKVKSEVTTEEKSKSSKKTKKSTKKKTTSTLRKRKVVEDNCINESEIQPMGQAGFSDSKVVVVAEVSEEKINNNPKNNPSQESTEAIISDPIVKLTDPILSGSNVVEATQSIVLPFAAIKVRNIVGKVNNLVTEIIFNKVIVQGIVHDQVFFVGNDGIVHHLADDVNFSTFLDIPGVQPGMNAQVSAIIEDILFELAPDGLSILKRIVIEVFVKVTETVQLNLVTGNGPTLFLKKVVGESTAQTLVESDLTLFTPAIKIDEIVGSIRDITVETIHDKVIVQGTLHKQIFFIDTANLGRHQAEDIPFSFFVDIPGATPGMNIQVQPRIEAIFFNLISATVVQEKAVLEFFVKVTENLLQQVTLGNGPLLKVASFIGENTVQELSETVVALNTPAIKIREIVARTQDIVSHVIPNKVIVQGTIHKQLYFIGTDNIEHHQAEDVPFSLFLDIPGVTPGNNVHLTTIIEGVFFELISSTELRQKVIIAVTAIVTEEEQLNLVVGSGPLFMVEQVVGENTKQLLVTSTEQIVPPIPPIIVIKPVVTSVIIDPPVETVIGSQQILLQNTFPLPIPAIKVKEIDPVVTNVSVQVIVDGVVFTGTVNKTIVFVGTDNIVRSIDEHVPFSILVNIPGVTPAQITSSTVKIEDIIFNINDSGTAVNQTVVLKAEVLGLKTLGQSTPVVTDVTGPGVSKTQVLVQGLVRTASGDQLQQFNAITAVSGPGIVGVTTTQTDILQIVGDPAPTPITVVTGVQIA
jgi:hypothetical protein